MKNFITVVKKEVKELITREFIFSLIGVIVIFGFVSRVTRTAVEEMEKEIKKEEITIGILDLDNSYYSQKITDILNQYIETKNIENLESNIKEDTLAAIIVIPHGFNKNIEEGEQAKLQIYYRVKELSEASKGLFTRISQIINIGSQTITNEFIKKAYPEKKTEIILSPLVYEDFTIINKEVKKGSPSSILGPIDFLSFIIALAIMYCIMFAGSVVITSMGQEKETKTLETLLTLPINRTYIISGKIIASGIVAAFMSIVYIIGISFSFTIGIGTPGEIQPLLKELLRELGITISFLDYVLLGSTLFLAIIVALTGCILLGVFVQDTKSAQTMSMPIFLLTFLPFILFRFVDISDLPPVIRIIMYANPFSYPFIVIKNIIFRNYGPTIYGIIYMIILTFILLAIAVRIFNTDKVLTGRISIKWRKKQ